MPTVVTTNAIQGQAHLFVGVFGTATVPADTVAALTVDPVTGWTYAGGTLDGVTVTTAQSYSKLKFDQVVDPVGGRMSEREITVETNLAEPTLENLAWLLNQQQTSVTTGTGIKSLNIKNATPGDLPMYTAVLIDGFAPNGKRRRIVVQKALSDGDIEFAYQTEDQSVFSVQWSAFYVSNSVDPVHYVDET